jgi:hypothetical protein
MTERRDVQSSLADMDRKLRELQKELGMASRESSPPPAAEPEPEPPAAERVPEPSAAEPTREPPAAEPTREPPAAEPTPPTPPESVAPDAPTAPLAAESQAQAIVAEARAEAARIVDEAAARVAAIGRQIDELQRLRDELQRSARALVEEYERALRYDAAPEPAPPEHAAPSGPATEDREFEGRVVVNAGPFTDIATLGAFEQALAGLPQAEDVFVHGFEGNRALIDVKLAAPVDLLDEMRRALPFGFGVVEVEHDRITIDLDPR